MSCDGHGDVAQGAPMRVIDLSGLGASTDHEQSFSRSDELLGTACYCIQLTSSEDLGLVGLEDPSTRDKSLADRWPKKVDGIV